MGPSGIHYGVLVQGTCNFSPVAFLQQELLMALVQAVGAFILTHMPLLRQQNNPFKPRNFLYLLVTFLLYFTSSVLLRYLFTLSDLTTLANWSYRDDQGRVLCDREALTEATITPKLLMGLIHLSWLLYGPPHMTSLLGQDDRVLFAEHCNVYFLVFTHLLAGPYLEAYYMLPSSNFQKCLFVTGLIVLITNLIVGLRRIFNDLHP